ncbi:MAG: hypothetical protein A3G41_00670 [Elusimicrobia bacterium RIFCSPLOWO2_12_FULL_59_9]|nr:MAG: hypothetical protein A3G41_00670 [Elusimicrobia bacterium RIFCSPLOWO2_12_FULL_59_9]
MTANLLIKRQLRPLEKRLLDPEFRKSAAEVADLLADDFVEFASSGRVYAKAQILDALRTASPSRFSLRDFKAVLLATGVAMTTFRLIRHDRPPAHSLRSSIWRLADGRWQMAFHQGTLSGQK